MSLPKKNKKDLKLKNTVFGPKNWSDQFLEQNKQFLPRGVDISDLELGFKLFVENLDFEVNGLSVEFMSSQRWAEFARGWKGSDKYKNIKVPFISVVRDGAPQPGTNPADFKIPVRKTFPYMKVPVWSGNKKGVDIYKIPNPVGVDLNYNVNFYSFRIRELNEVSEVIKQTFASAQAYVNVKGHYFPVLLEGIEDASVFDSIDEKRYYVQNYKMRMQGYIVDEEEFEVVPAIERVLVLVEPMVRELRPIVKTFKGVDKTKTIQIIIQFLPKTVSEITFHSEDTIKVKSVGSENLSSYVLHINGEAVVAPFTINKDDTIYLQVNKLDVNETSEIILNGVIGE